jgi:RNA polymerase sigma-70 factor (ECF subfamily)
MQSGLALGNLASVIGVRQEEAAVIDELKAGSESAFSWLVAQYHQPIYSLIARTIQNPAEAADLTQEVFVKVYRGIGSFHGDSSLRTWIYRIALHEASNQRRWWGRHKRQEITIETACGEGEDGNGLFIKDMLVDGHDSPYEMCAQHEMRERVEEEIRKVPEPFRTVVILRDIEGFGYEEIAEILSTNLGTIKSRLMRGRAQLKIQLAPYVTAAAKRPSATVRSIADAPANLPVAEVTMGQADPLLRAGAKRMVAR